MVNFMKNISKFKVEWSILLPLILFGIISVISIYCTNSLMDNEFQNFYLKQIVWYIVGFIIAYSMMLLGNKFLYNNAWWFYIIGVISLILVLFFGHEANNATCWFKIGPLSIQPSEFMKVFLIIILSRLINNFYEKNDNPEVIDEFKFLLKIFVKFLVKKNI